MRGNVEITSDTIGFDFGPYLLRALYRIKMNWYNVIPEVAGAPLMKKGSVIIAFAITKDGHVTGMVLQLPSGDVLLDRAAWGGITASNPFEPLPAEFSGNYLGLRIRFVYNQPSDPFTVPLGVRDPLHAPPISSGDAAAAQPAELNQSEDIKVLFDAKGVDFSSYLQHLALLVRQHWYQVIPDQAKKPVAESGTVIIRFAVLPDGSVARMRISGPSGNADLDQAAWRSVQESSPFAPLPKEFTGPDLVVSVRFGYNPKTKEGKQDNKNQILLFSSGDQLTGTFAPKP